MKDHKDENECQNETILKLRRELGLKSLPDEIELAQSAKEKDDLELKIELLES